MGGNPMQTCQSCGAVLGEAARFCNQCGAPVGEATTETTTEIQPDQTTSPPLAPPAPGPSRKAVRPPQKKRSIFWPVLGALVVFFIVIPIVAFAGCVGCAACGTVATVGVVAHESAPASPTPTPRPATTVSASEPVTIGDPSDAVWVKCLGTVALRSVPFLGIWPTEVGTTFVGRGHYLVVILRFTNVGQTPYHAQVANWAWLTVKTTAGTKRLDAAARTDFADTYNVNDNLSDLQGRDHTGRLEIAPGKSTKWAIAFPVTPRMHRVSFTYQGPGNRRVTWVF